MRSLQDYRDIYSSIASDNKITGDSVELLVQLLANASYLSEIENISYTREASLETATLVNSKIQHCMDRMYSVFRGRCPRVILRFKPTKYFDFQLFDPIVASNDFSIYYLGYLPNEEDEDDTEYYDSSESEVVDPRETGTRSIPLEEGFIYGPSKFSPTSGTVTIIGLLAKEKLENDWSINKYNTYYVSAQGENLSSDMWVKIKNDGVNGDGEFYDTTRVFSTHILDHYIFDLTTTSYGSRLYVADIFKSGVLDRDDETSGDIDSDNVSVSLHAEYYKFSRISEYKPAELKKINLGGAEMESFDYEFLRNHGGYTETAAGVLIIPEVDRDGIGTIHYKANRDRYVSSIIRSNSDVGVVLEETYPEKVMSGGTNYIFSTGSDNSSGSRVDLYYVPTNPYNTLTDSEITDFTETKKAYYIVDDIYVTAGRRVIAFLNIDIELYKPFTIDTEISDILSTYENKFGVNLDDSIEEIKTLLSKISNIKQVSRLEVMYLDQNGYETVSGNETYPYDENNEVKPDVYFKIEYNINSIIQTRS